jgi:alcohol dehydrogenase class IV
MVKPFQFARIPAIVFGSGSVSKLCDQILRFGKTAVIVTGSNSFMRSGAAARLFENLEQHKISYRHITVGGEPSPELVDSSVRSMDTFDPGVVVGIGGGSVLDAGKAISAMKGIGESVTRYLEGVGDLEHPGTKIPFIAVPTTSGTGSEATKNAVISRTGPEGFKRSLRHDNFVPELALVDPELTLNCTPAITAASGMDCFTQLTEAYLSDKASAFTDALALEGLKALKRSLKRCFNDGSDIQARSEMSYAALTSGICLANAGLGTVHGFASSLGGLFDIPHGVVCGTLMASANKINVRELRKRSTGNQVLKKYAILGQLFLDRNGETEDYYIDGFTDYLQILTEELDLPLLGSYGLQPADVPAVCRITENKNNPVKLGYEEIEEILTMRIV